MKIFIVILSLAVIASCAPQGFRQTDVLELEEPSSPARSPSNDLVAALLKTLSSQQRGGNSRRQIGLPNEEELLSRRPSGAAGGGLLRIMLALLAEELGLSGLEGRLDGIDQEAVIRNVIKAVQTVGSVLLA